MIATVNASIANAPATTSAMAAASEVSAGRANPHCGRQDRRGELSAMGWNERRRVVLLLHEYALGRACQDRRMRERSTAARAWRASIRTTRAGCSGGVRFSVLGECDFPEPGSWWRKPAAPGYGDSLRLAMAFIRDALLCPSCAAQDLFTPEPGSWWRKPAAPGYGDSLGQRGRLRFYE